MKKILLTVVFILSTTFIAASHPATDMELIYDPQQQMLEVKMRHVTTEIREHYIRLITVTINNQEPQIFRYVKQAAPSYVDVLLPVEAKPGDNIHVRAKCIKGGIAEADLQIPKEEEQKSP